MANIVPLSELIYNASRISKLCHSKGEPVFLTKDGFGDMVVLSMEQYELMNARAQAYLANSKADAMQQTPAAKDSLKQETTDDENDDKVSALAKHGIEKIPLEDVMDILEGSLGNQQTKDNKPRKRFP